MNIFLVDLTHGGVKISTELAKSEKYEKVYAYDLYNTLKSQEKSLLDTYDVKVLESLDEFKKELKSNSLNKKSSEKDLIINPDHSSLNIENLLDNNISNDYEIINHHKATALVLNRWIEEAERQNIKSIELTGVKGKTSVAFILKEIFLENEKNVLLLSSLGAHLFRKNKNYDKNNDSGNGNVQDLILQKNISITPANIINTIQLAKKIANPKCAFPSCSTDEKDLAERNKALEELEENPYSNLNYDIAIFENSLGVCGFGDIGILTNLVENYSIAKGQKDAREAKRQVFDCPLVVIEYDTLKEHYPNESINYKDKINSFSIDNQKSNVYCPNIEYGLEKTKVDLVYNNLKTINNNVLNGEISLNCFAPGPHHVLNILTAITTALSLEIDEKDIINGLSNFKGIEGRTQVKRIEDSIIIEEINPGINTKAIESSIKMIKDIENYHIIIGGKYGVTCEEIDEDKLSKFLDDYMENNPYTDLVLSDELGKSLKEKIDDLNKEDKYKIIFIEDYNEAQERAIRDNKNILFIYRSNYSQISKR